MAKKIILTMTQSPERGDPVVILKGGTYDTETGTIDPGGATWLAPLQTDGRDYDWELTFENATSLAVSPSSIAIQGTSTTITTSPDR